MKLRLAVLAKPNPNPQPPSEALLMQDTQDQRPACPSQPPSQPMKDTQDVPLNSPSQLQQDVEINKMSLPCLLAHEQRVSASLRANLKTAKADLHHNLLCHESECVCGVPADRRAAGCLGALDDRTVHASDTTTRRCVLVPSGNEAMCARTHIPTTTSLPPRAHAPGQGRTYSTRQE